MSKSNELIQMRLLELDRPLGLSEMKVANAIYSKVSPDDEEFKPYTLSVRELAGLAGLASDRLYREISRVTSRLCGTVVTVRRTNNDGFMKAALFSTAEYIASEEVVNFKIAPDLIPYLPRLRDSGGGFTQYHLDQTTSLQSKHSLRLYELLRQFLPLSRVKEGVTSGFRRIAVSDLREYLGIQNKYDRYTELRRAVIDPVKKELAEKTDLSFEFTPERTRRTITSLNFTIKVNERPKQVESEQPGQPVELLPECENKTMLKMVRMTIPSIPDRNAILLVNAYSQDLLTEALLELMEAKDDVRNPVAYLIGILKNKRLEGAKAFPGRTHRTTEEKLTDRSWAEGLCFDDEDEWD